VIVNAAGEASTTVRRCIRLPQPGQSQPSTPNTFFRSSAQVSGASCALGPGAQGRRAGVHAGRGRGAAVIPVEARGMDGAALGLAEKLVAIVPSPRVYTVIYSGVLAANAALRPEVIPKAPTSIHAEKAAPEAQKLKRRDGPTPSLRQETIQLWSQAARKPKTAPTPPVPAASSRQPRKLRSPRPCRPERAQSAQTCPRRLRLRHPPRANHPRCG